MIILRGSLVRFGFVALILLGVAAVGFCQDDSTDYMYYGNAGFSALSGWNGSVGSSSDASLTGSAFLELNHRFSFEKAELFIHHEIAQSLQRDDSTASPQTLPTPEFSLYEAYVRLFPLDNVSVTLGRHRIQWGNGLLLSPTDSFQPSAFQGATGTMPTTSQDSAAQTGITGLGAQFYPSSRATVSLGGSFDDAIDSGGLSAEAIRTGGIAYFNPGALEFFLSGVYQKDKTIRPGVGASLDFWGVIFRGEAALEFVESYEYPAGTASSVSFEKDDEDGPRLGGSAGIEKVLFQGDYSISLFAEYLYLGWGYTEEQETLLLSGNLSAEPSVPTPLGRHYANVLAELSLNDRWDWENLFMFDLTGPGIMGSHSFTFLGFKGLSLKAGVTWLAGADDTEFGSSDEKVFGTIETRVNF